VTATLKATQAKYAEGIMTYANGEFLHHYLTIKNTMTEVIRGDAEDQAQADRELYALLVHTSSTHASFEFAIYPWGNRNFEDNLSPHGWFAAEYRTLPRTMLVAEKGTSSTCSRSSPRSGLARANSSPYARLHRTSVSLRLLSISRQRAKRCFI
jgi:hypothetical protein